MSAQPVTADVGIGTVEGEIVERIPSPEWTNITGEILVVESQGSRYRVDPSDIETENRNEP